MIAVYLVICAVIALIACLFAACRIARSATGLPASTRAAIRRQRRALRAKLPGDRIRRP